MSLWAGNLEDFSAKSGYEISYEKALAKAKLQNKPIMLVMVTHYCPWCRKYERDTLGKKSIIDFVNKKYVTLVLNREDSKYPKKFDTPRIPTTFFVNQKDESIIYSEMGFKTKKDFFEMHERLVDPSKR